MKKMMKHVLPGLLCTGMIFQANALTLKEVGEYRTGVFDESAAEIPAYDKTTKKLFVVNAGDKTVDVLNLNDPSNITRDTSLSMADYGYSAPNSVATYNGLIAVAAEAAVKQDSGAILLLDATNNYSLVKAVKAGALPDMVAFSKDGQLIMSANEGEPNSAYDNDPEGSMTLISMSDTSATQIDFKAFNDSLAVLQAKGVRISGKNATVAQDLEPEYVTFSDDGTKAWVSLQENNALAKIDLATKQVEEIIPLGLKNHFLPENGLDAIPDDQFKIQNHAVKSMYMPDAIKSFQVAGQTYILTANEGDGREYLVEHPELTTEEACDSASFDWDDGDCIEEAWVDEGKLSKLDLDSTAFTTEELASLESLPSKLLILNTEGDTDNDGLVEEVVMMGARSFSIRAEDGTLVWDSGSEFESYIGSKIPDNFNASNDKNELENRSRKKGPEPEGVETGVIGDQTYAFIGIERMGGVMIYNVTNPASPVYVDYFNDRDFSANDSNLVNTNLGPEGMVFIPAAESPNGKNLLTVSYEVSGSTVVYEVGDFDLYDNKIHTMEATSELAADLEYFGESDSSLTGIAITEGGWSDLALDPNSTASALKFWSINDRGINVAHKNNGRNDKVFYAPNYHQKLVSFSIDTDDSLRIATLDSIKGMNGKYVTGVVNPILPTGEVGLLGNKSEALVDTTALVSQDSSGFDYEGLVFHPDGYMYLSDEYGPFITQVNPKTNNMYDYFYPGKGLPEVLATRRPNRGMEGLAVNSQGILMGIMQSPLYNVKAAAKGSDTKNKARMNRIVSFDPATLETKQYAYINDVKGGNRNVGDIKIGAMTMVDDSTYLVVEHGKDKSSHYWFDVYKITIDTNTTDITSLDTNTALSPEEMSYDLESFLETVVPVKKELLIGDLMHTTSWPHTKPEGIVVLDSGRLAINNDNDYGMSAIGDDGIPHILPANQRASELMILDLPSNKKLAPQKVSITGTPKDREIIVALQNNANNANLDWSLKGNNVLVNLSEASQVKVSAYDVEGKLLKAFDTQAESGKHAYNLEGVNANSGLVVIRVELTNSNSKVQDVRILPLRK